MTVIAWDGRRLAGDKRATNNGMQRTVTKVFKVRVPATSKRNAHFLLVGVSGSYDFGLAMVDWVRKGSDPDEFPKFQRDKDTFADVLVVDDGELLKYEQTPFPIRFEDKTYAMGTGRDFAMAAMYCGKGAEEAVRVACFFQTDCGNGVDVVTLEE